MDEKTHEMHENKEFENKKSNIDENQKEEIMTEETVVDDKMSENSELEKLKLELSDYKDKYLRLVAEFDNFKKRSFKEKMETIQTAGKDIMTSLIEVIDDIERAEKQVESSEDIKGLKEGTNLIFNKLKNNLTAKGLKSFDCLGKEFDEEQHEAVAVVPASNKEQDNKIVDILEKGYLLNDKIIRHAKVVVAKANE
ncbi:MAG TPA: nucleotide exchange factor GrpE [Chitinophagaceae bacterium]|nr:nucleotide exchange factor GrpE [Chitinophagaceae bacterium]